MNVFLLGHFMANFEFVALRATLAHVTNAQGVLSQIPV
jgi:hypothetical protein